MRNSRAVLTASGEVHWMCDSIASVHAESDQHVGRGIRYYTLHGDNV